MEEPQNSPTVSGEFDDGLISLHEEHETADGSLVLFQCTECGYVSLSLARLHGHIERHRGYTRFNIQLPFTQTSPGNLDELNDRTRILRTDETTEITREEVESL